MKTRVYGAPYDLARMLEPLVTSALAAAIRLWDSVAVMFSRAWPLMLIISLAVPACAARDKTPTPAPPATTTGRPKETTAPPARPLEVREGLASYYGPGFEGRVTASGAKFDKNAMVAAHPTYPFDTVIRVTNLANGRRVIVRVVDRGPAKNVQAEGVLIDLSSGAATNLGITSVGRARVRLEVLRWGK